MDVAELEKLADWYVVHFNLFNQHYQQLINPIQQNVHQGVKQPIEPAVNTLIAYLDEMDFEVLSIQQIKTLEKLGVAPFIGSQGSNFIDATIRTSNFDPATALSELNAAFSKLSSVKSAFDAFIQSLAGLNLRHDQAAEANEFITIRIGFQNDASIENMTEWKDTAKEWYDIIRGLALASNEAPEETRIVGATSGSIILILAGTAAVTELLARISKHVSGVAKEGLEIRHSIEDLRHKKILTAVMEQELEKLIDDRKKAALDSIMKEVKPLLADANGDKIPALTNSIKKLLVFNEQGGNVDFVAPENDDDEAEASAAEDAGSSDKKTAISAVREAIHEYQEAREQLKLLSYGAPAAK